MNEFEASTEGSELKRVLHQRAWKYVLDIAGDDALTGDRLHDAIEALAQDKAVDDEALWEVPADLHVTPRLDEVFEMASRIELETPAEPELNSITDGHQNPEKLSHLPGPDTEFTVSVRAAPKIELTVARDKRRMRRRDHTRPSWKRMLGIGEFWTPLKSGMFLGLMFMCSMLCSILLPTRAELDRALETDSVPWYVMALTVAAYGSFVITLVHLRELIRGLRRNRLAAARAREEKASEAEVRAAARARAAKSAQQTRNMSALHEWKDRDMTRL